MKIKIIGEGKHRIANNMLVFTTNKGLIEMDFRSAEEVTWLLLDALCFSDKEIQKIINKIEDSIYEGDDL